MAPAATSEPVTLIDYDAEPKKKSSQRFSILHARHPLMQLREIAAKMSVEERGKILEEHFRQTPPPPRQTRPGV